MKLCRWQMIIIKNKLVKFFEMNKPTVPLRYSRLGAVLFRALPLTCELLKKFDQNFTLC